MPLTADSIRFAQSELKGKGLYPDPIDGLLGPATATALQHIPDLKAAWPLERKVVGYLQLMAADKDIDTGAIDGLWGPQTEEAYKTLTHLRLFNTEPAPWRPEGRTEANPNNWPSQRTDQELIAFYGAVGTNQKKITLPYPHRLAWDTGTVVNSFQ